MHVDVPPFTQSFTKDMSPQLRYKSLMRRHERVDDALGYWSRQKYSHMAVLLKEVRFNPLASFLYPPLLLPLPLPCLTNVVSLAISPMLQTWDITHKRIEYLEGEIAEILEIAAQQDFVLDQGAAFSLDVHAPAVDLHIQYVKTLLHVRQLNDMCSTAAVYAASMDTTAARAMIARAHDSSLLARLKATLEDIEQKLGITSQWAEDDSRFKVRCCLCDR
jgi:hypothetical protein